MKKINLKIDYKKETISIDANQKISQKIWKFIKNYKNYEGYCPDEDKYYLFFNCRHDMNIFLIDLGNLTNQNYLEN